MNIPYPVIATNLDVQILPAGTRKAAAEYQKLYGRLEYLAAEVERLQSPEVVAAAQAADQEAQAKAVRAGKAAHTAGTPASDELAAQLKAATVELEGTVVAVHQVERELEAAMVAAWESDDASGRTLANEAVQAYRNAVASLSTLRKEAVQALCLPMFVARLTSPMPADQPERTIRFQAPNIPQKPGRVYINAADPVPIPLMQDLLGHDAAMIAERVDAPKW